jgi:predicted AAA+ superfamily ATPase
MYLRRLYQDLVIQHFRVNRQMLFLMGPRQVGKTTISQHIHQIMGADFYYLNWDNVEHRAIILKGPKAIASYIEHSRARKIPPLLVLDEIHKFTDWKDFLKGFFDTYASSGEVSIVVTGSARLDAYHFGGDSLMGRYFRYRIHPLSVAELMEEKIIEQEIRAPQKISSAMWEGLYTFGGFPEPLTKNNAIFYAKWKQLRLQQLFYEEVRDISRIFEVKQMELLALVLTQQVGGAVNYTNLANKIRVSSETIRRWLSILNQLYFCFSIQPWSKNVARSLLKEPKVYLCDWSLVDDPGAKAENFVAAHLLKACHFWTDSGMGVYGLHFLRDKDKREIDFLVTKNDEPWFLVEVKSSNVSLSPNLEYFQKQIGAKHAFQVVMDLPYEEIDCFKYIRPVVVPAKTFFAQLV